jgi:hypothetical protein
MRLKIPASMVSTAVAETRRIASSFSARRCPRWSGDET